MEFVRSDAEVERIRETMETNRYDGARSLSIRYRTRPDVVEHVLPPGLTPTDEPLAEMSVFEITDSNCVGPFTGGALYVSARYEDRIGKYCLTMPMSTDAAIVWGRELFGEPKKGAACSLTRDGDTCSGHVDRYGDRIAQLDATLTDEQPVDEATETVFHYKHTPSVDGDGFHAMPTLVAIEMTNEIERFETGDGAVSLRSTECDPLGEIAVETVLGAGYAEADLTTRQEPLTTVDPESFAPYAYGAGRMDDPAAVADHESPSGTREHGAKPS